MPPPIATIFGPLLVTFHDFKFAIKWSIFLDSNINLPNDLYNPYEQINKRHTPTTIRIVASVETGKTFGGRKSNRRPKTQASPIAIIKMPLAPIRSQRFIPIPKNSICKFSLNKSCNNITLNTRHKTIHGNCYLIIIFSAV